MGTKITQFFCHHIYKVDREEFLRTKNFIVMDKSDLCHPFIKKYNYYAMFESCVICDKTRVREERRLYDEDTEMHMVN